MHRTATRVSIPHASLVLASFLLSIAGAVQAQSRGRQVQCHVETAGRVEMSGQCLFTRERGGSFTLENADRDKPLFGEVLMVSVSIVSPDVAEVRGLTIRGINSRWGPARRDGACWEGSDFRICAR